MSFASNTEWKTPVVVIELHDWLLPKQGSSEAFLQCISRQSRDFVFRGDNVFSIAHTFD